MTPIQSARFSVPGATLPYTVRGTGTFLLLIAGGEGGAAGYNAIADILSDRYTVVTYDRRGAPGTLLDNPDEDVRLETHSDDASRLLSSLTSEPAYIFGSSAGALVGLDLVVHRPDQVRVRVAHEPPVEGILPEFDRYQNEMAEAQRQGNGPAAMLKFFAQTMVRYEDLEPGVVLQPRDPQETAARGQALLRYTFPAVHHYRLDVAALAASPVRVVLAGGSVGQDTPVFRCTQTLATRLGAKMVEFPSHHAGYVSHPRAFAARLDEMLKG